MFGLIRRISHSIIPRPDRPWEDDRTYSFFRERESALFLSRRTNKNPCFFWLIATSNAPTRRKRRISTTEREDTGDEEQTRKKRARGEDPENPGSDDIPSSPAISPVDASSKANDDTDVEADTPGEPDYTIQREGSLEVKVVTKGVNEVELEDKETGADDVTSTSAPTTADEVPAHPGENTADASTSSTVEEPTTTDVNPESIPLPEEKAGELDEEEVPSSSPVPEPSAHTREDSAATAVESSTEAPEPESLKVNDNETPFVEVPSRPETPRQTRTSRSAASSVRKLRSKSPKKVSTRA
ncbi:hypothetical protein NP233_g7875 [Leucocoprinus birnbaumii]|uniref:Uncharacterized protein n=1 Tax=Leucocoprinus birnbaumii TaxID=56174 RepID=A0AAD5YSC9_9AGAR|nr:hypothetical protein NP233_g7875 [Leucocoprinus birnbaumii]